MRCSFRVLSCGLVFHGTISGVTANQHDTENFELSETISQELGAADNLTRQTFARRLITVGGGTATKKVGPGAGWDGGDNTPLQDGGDANCWWRKCKACEGDCDGDSQCIAPLKCYTRWDRSPIPNCESGGTDDNWDDDFCYKPHTKKLKYKRAGCAANKKCGKCEGDCDTDSECASGLQCFHRTLLSSAEVLGCVGDAGGNAANDYIGQDYCVVASTVKTVGWDGGLNVPLFEGGNSFCTSRKKCKTCEGDCDTDAQCGAGLKCYHRSFGESVPNCGVGGDHDWAGTDYCYTPFTKELRYPRECSPTKKCKHCEGDCDKDSDCGAGLRCFFRIASEEVPGCLNEGTGDHNGYDYCILKTVPSR